MSFFNEIDETRVVERNIQRLQGIEVQQAKRLLKSFVEARKRIKAALLDAADESFTQAQLELNLSQVKLIIEGLQRNIRGQVKTGADMVIEQGVDDLGREIGKFSQKFEGISRTIPVDAIINSLDSENVLLNRFNSSLIAYSRSYIDTIERELTQAIISTEPRTRLVNRLTDKLQLDEWKVLRIARTELHNIYNMTKNESMIKVKEDLIPDLKKSLFHPLDGRTGEDSKFAAELDLVVDVDKPFRYTFKGKKRVFLNPPDRPNDRSIIVPYREVWDR